MSVSLDKLPPHSEEAEKAVLGAILLQPDLFLQISSSVNGGHFYNLVHREIFKAMQSLHDGGKLIDAINICAIVKEKQIHFADVLGLAEFCDHQNNWPEHAQVVIGKWKLRKAVKAIGELSEKLMDGDEEAIQELKQVADAMSVDAGNVRSGDYSTASEFMPQVWDILEKEYNQEATPGVKTGFADFDRLTGGLQNGEVTVLAARPNVGKTALAMNIVENLAVNEGIPVGVFSMEMNRIAIGKRLIASQSRVDLKAVRNQTMSQADFSRMSGGYSRVLKSKILLNETPSITVEKLSRSVRHMHSNHGVRLVVVDYLQLMRDTSDKPQTREREVAQMSNAIKILATELNIPFLVIAQLNRSIESGNTNRRPRLSDLRESGAIEQDADTVVFLYRQKDNEEANTESNVETIKCLIAKQRNGQRGIEFDLTFFKTYTRFESASREMRTPYAE